MTDIDESVAVWTTDDGVPTRLVWRATRYRVTDTPTVWAEICTWWRPFGEHRYGVGSLPREIGGWRFQGTSDSGDAHVFDVRHDPGERTWRLVRVFD
ncbi:DUF6504 family protein [uncultured Leifsonia sp.]|uniref:DUF6504 family protein n=1 Tax=Leifsonia sp. TaxID=1870902 RepID=UPI0028D46843|nr:DUF6504 family protein [uncultured Leifsonia sp.]